MEAVYIVNPRSGRGRGARIAASLPALLESLGLTGRILVTSRPGEATALAREASREAEVVVAVGGDGTCHEVVNGLAGTKACLGVVPVGSGNDLACALGIPTDIVQALEVIRRGRRKRIDLGRFDDRWFANSLGLGFEAQVTIESRKITRLRGFAIYLAALVMAFRRFHCPDLVIRTDETVYEGRRLLVCVGNGPRVGGGFRLTPNALPDDGVFDLCLVDAMPRLRVLKTLPRSIQGTHVSDPAVTMARAKRIEFRSEEGFPFHADGEVIDDRRRVLTIELVPGALEVMY